jgi:hypothetical protein
MRNAHPLPTPLNSPGEGKSIRLGKYRNLHILELHSLDHQDMGVREIDPGLRED